MFGGVLECSTFLPVGEVNISVLRKWTTCLLTALVFLHEKAEQAPIIHGHIQCASPIPSIVDAITSSSREVTDLSALVGMLGSVDKVMRFSMASTPEPATTAMWVTSPPRPCLARSGRALWMCMLLG